VNLTETGQLLRLVVACDRRTVSEIDLEVWHRLLGEYPFAQCETAVFGHFSESSEWLTPALVRQRVRGLRAANLSAALAQGEPAPLVDPDDPVAWNRARAQWRGAAADGRVLPARRELTAGVIPDQLAEWKADLAKLRGPQLLRRPVLPPSRVAGESSPPGGHSGKGAPSADVTGPQGAA
jgi:hypothetical protein